MSFYAATILLAATSAMRAQAADSVASYIRATYTKREYQVPMRDGVRLFTTVYTPKEAFERNPRSR